MLSRKLQRVEEGDGFRVDKSSTWNSIYNIEKSLCNELLSWNLATVVYNPLDYAKDVHCAFLRRYMNSPKQVLFVGLNPGPHGMCQNGVWLQLLKGSRILSLSTPPLLQVPFGNVPDVLGYLQLSGKINKPVTEHPERPILGFRVGKEEQSGKRVWKLIRAVYGSLPDHFFSFCGITNLCPLGFFDAAGRNVTPETFPAAARKEFVAICTGHLKKILEILSPRTIVCFGRFVEKCLRGAEVDTEVIYMPHPSPRAANNQNWVEDTIRLIIDEHPSLLPEHGGSH